MMQESAILRFGTNSKQKPLAAEATGWHTGADGSLVTQGRVQGKQHDSRAAKQAMVAKDFRRAIDLYTQASGQSLYLLYKQWATIESSHAVECLPKALKALACRVH